MSRAPQVHTYDDLGGEAPKDVKSQRIDSLSADAFGRPAVTTRFQIVVTLSPIPTQGCSSNLILQHSPLVSITKSLNYRNVGTI